MFHTCLSIRKPCFQRRMACVIVVKGSGPSRVEQVFCSTPVQTFCIHPHQVTSPRMQRWRMAKQVTEHLIEQVSNKCSGRHLFDQMFTRLPCLASHQPCWGAWPVRMHAEHLVEQMSNVLLFDTPCDQTSYTHPTQVTLPNMFRCGEVCERTSGPTRVEQNTCLTPFRLDVCLQPATLRLEESGSC